MKNLRFLLILSVLICPKTGRCQEIGGDLKNILVEVFTDSRISEHVFDSEDSTGLKLVYLDSDLEFQKNISNYRDIHAIVSSSPGAVSCILTTEVGKVFLMVSPFYSKAYYGDKIKSVVSINTLKISNVESHFVFSKTTLTSIKVPDFNYLKFDVRLIKSDASWVVSSVKIRTTKFKSIL